MQLLADSQENPVELVERASEPNDAVSAESSTTAADLESTVTDTEEPFVYKVGLLNGVTTSNFWAYFGSAPTVWDAYVLAPTKASLYRLDPTSLNLVPELASGLAEPTWNVDGWHAIVSLRDNMKWSDGLRITASDVSFTFRTVRTLGLGGQWADVFPAGVTGVKALDDLHLEITFATRPSLRTWPYGTGTAPIMASHVWGPKIVGMTTAAELFALDGADDVAGGPIDLVQVGEDRIVARANPGYQGESVVPIVEYVVFASEAEMLAELTAGGIHTMASPQGLQPDQAATLAQTEGIKTVTNPKFGVRYLSFNTKREPMNDLAFRKAVAALVDRDALASEVAGASIANTMLPAAATAWFDGDAAAAIVRPLASDLATSWVTVLADLKTSGYTWTVDPTLVDGKLVAGTGLEIKGRAPAALTILTSGDSFDPARPEYANRVAAAIELLGFKVIPVTTDFTSVVDLSFTADEEGKVHYDMALLGWSLGNPGLPTFYGDLFGTAGAVNNTGYSSAAMDALIKSLDKAPNLEKARAAIWKMETLIAQDLPYLPLYASQITEAYRADMVGYPEQSLLGGIQAALAGIELVTPQD